MQDQPTEGGQENLRIELDRALEHVAATRDILRVISQSRDDEMPVFRAILDRAERLCGARGSGLQLLNETGTHLRILATMGKDKGAFPLGTEFDLNGPAGMCVAVREGRVVHIEDLKDTELYRQGHEGRRKLVDVEGRRTHFNVPLMKDGTAFGNITLGRNEVKPFTPDQIALVETFAEQAVIAIDNVRQFKEVQSRLEREAATREILAVISQSRDDEQPVFEAIVSNAARLCGAPAGVGLHLLNEARTHTRLACVWGPDVGAFPLGTEFELSGSLPQSIAIRETRVVHTPNMRQSDLYLAGDKDIVAKADEEGVGTFLSVPLIKDGIAIGCFNLNRYDVTPYTEAEIALAETFAAQAVIAIENVRQFRELQTRLERERATGEVLEVISQSRDDVQPVFDVVLEMAARLCGAPFAFLILTNAERTNLTIPAYYGTRSKFVDLINNDPLPLDPSQSISAQAVVEKRPLQVADFRDTPIYRAGQPHRVHAVEVEGIRTVLAVPLLGGDEAIGVILLYRRELALFKEDEIALAQTFSQQAVIAIENVRQFKALEQLNAELGDRVNEQVGEIERMGRLKRFLPAAVADAVVSQGSDKLLTSHRALLGVLFCDIRGFTAFCETAEPEETIEVLQTYHEEMGALIADHGAGVDTRAGDGIMVLFNDPLPCDDPAGDALRLGLAMRSRMEELCGTWRRHGHKLGFGVGISLGYATVGMVGAAGRTDYTASGTAVNLAARLCDKAEDGEILLSPRAYSAVGEDFSADSIGEISLKGIHASVEVFKVSGAK